LRSQQPQQARFIGRTINIETNGIFRELTVTHQNDNFVFLNGVASSSVWNWDAICTISNGDFDISSLVQVGQNVNVHRGGDSLHRQRRPQLPRKRKTVGQEIVKYSRNRKLLLSVTRR